MKYISLFLVILMCFSFSGCATATPVPLNAAPEQIEQINAQNLAAIAKNTATLNGIVLATIAVAILGTLISGVVIGSAVGSTINSF